MTHTDRILVPVDFSPCSKAALDWGLEMASRFDAEVIVLHVTTMPDLSPLSPTLEALVPSYAVLQELLDARFDVTRETMDSWLELYASKAVSLVPVYAEGTDYETILEICEARDCQIIIMGTHGRTGLDRMLLGSTTERIVRTAKVPVLTVHAE